MAQTIKNIAVIGCGAVSKYGHLPAIAEAESWRLKAVVDPDPDKRVEARSAYGAEHALACADELWGIGDLDAVAVVTHLDSHHALVVDALEHGVHVLCEKPMASTVGQCEEMVAAADRAGKLLAVNFNTRSQQIYREINQVVEAGILGTIHVSRFSFIWSNHQWRPAERLEEFMANGGPIIDSGVHFFDGVRRFTGRQINQVYAAGVFLPPYEHPQHVMASCHLEEGGIALVEAGWLYTKNTKEQDALYFVELIGDQGSIHADLISSTVRVHGQDLREVRRVEQTDKGFDWVYERFAKSIERGELIDLASGEDGLRATDAAFRALESAHQNRGANQRGVCELAAHAGS